MATLPGPTRRAVGGAFLLLMLSGCGIHLEQDAPDIPLIPERTPIPAEADLVDLLAATRRWATDLERSASAEARRLAPRAAEQAAVLDSALRAGGVPANLIDPPPAPTASPSARRSVARSELAQQAAASLPVLDKLIGAAQDDLAVPLAAMAASRAVMIRRLDHKADPNSSASPARAALPAGLCAALLPAGRETAYGLEVVAARATGSTRERAIANLDEVRELLLLLEAGATGEPPPPLGYPLPLEVTDNATAARLAEGLTTALVDAVAAALRGFVADRAALAGGARYLTATALLADEWDAPVRAFPGLS